MAFRTYLRSNHKQRLRPNHKQRYRRLRVENLEPRLALVAEIEPNDSLAQATLFTTGSVSHTGNLASLADRDYFQVVLGQGDRLTANYGQPSTFDPEIVGAVELLDDTGRVLSTKVTNLPAEAMVPKAGTYYVRTSPRNDYGEFTGNYVLATSVATFSGTSEAEPNNTTGTANSLSNGAYFRGSLSAVSDLDYFSFSGSSGQTVSINLTNLPAESPTVIVYRPDGSELGRGEVGIGVQLSLPVSGTYRFAMSAARSVGTFVGQYVGRLNLATAAVTIPATATGFDTASAIALGSSPVNVVGMLTAVNVPQYLYFNVTTLNHSSVSLTGLPYNVKVSLFNERGQTLEYRHSSSLNTSAVDVAFTAGRYYVSVQALSEMGLGPFQISVARSTSISTQRDVPLYFIDLTGQQPTHLGRAWVAPFSVPAASNLVQGLMESRYASWDVDVTQTMPPAGTEHVAGGFGDFGNIGAGGYGSGGFGNRRPSGDSVSDARGAWTSLSYGRVLTLIHEMGHATGLLHARSVQGVMGYVNDDEIFPVGSSYLFPWTDSLVPSTYQNNARDYLDWALQAGRQIIEPEPNDTPAAAVSLEPFLNEMRADSSPNNDRAVVFGRIDSASDVDRYTFNAAAGQKFALDIEAAEFQYPLDAVLTIFDSSGNLIAQSDDALDRDTGVTSVDPYLTHTFTTAGTYHVQVSAKWGTVGHYRLKVTPGAALDADGPKIIGTVPAGQTSVKARRQIVLFANDQIDPATLTSANFVVQGNTSGVRTGSAYFDPFESVIVWTADAILPNDTYTVTLSGGATGITDLKGNRLDGETDGSFAFPEISGNNVAGGNFSFTFTVNATDTTAAAVNSSSYSRNPYNRGEFNLGFNDELSLASVAAAVLTARGAGPDATFNTADDRILPLDVLQDSMNHRQQIRAFTRGIPDPDQYRIEGTIRDSAGFTINLSTVIHVAVEVPESALFTTAALTQTGLVGSYVNSSLRSYATQDDWRVSQTVVGTRTDPTIDFATGDFGVRSQVGVTGGSDANWDNFSTQWDGYLQVPVAGTRLLLRSAHGSRLWIDLNNDGVFNTTGAEFFSNGWGSTGSTTGTLSSAIAAAGTYRIRVQYEHATGSEQAYLEWLTPDLAGQTDGIGHGPSVIDSSIQPGSVVTAAALDSLSVRFSGAINSATLTTANFKVRYSPDGRFYNGDDTYLTESDGLIAWNAVEQRATFQASQPLARGHYLLELNGDAGGITDTAGHLLDGEYLDSYIAGNVLPMQWQDTPSGDGVAGGDYLAAFSITNFTATVANAGNVLEDSSAPLVFEFTRTGDVSTAGTISFGVSGNATFGSDYTQTGAATFTATTGTVNFAAGAATATVLIHATADSVVEADESVVLTITPGAAYLVGTSPAATGTILNDDSDMFQAQSYLPTSTGVIVNFNRQLNPAMLNLYDLQGGILGAADLTLVGATNGSVRGSLVIDPNLQQVTFVATPGRLPPDSYTLTLRGSSDAFQDSTGQLLDGDGNGAAGGDYVRTFVVSAPAANAVTVEVPNFARGPQQNVNLPADGTSGIPLSFSKGEGITSATLEIRYDPALLNISGASVAPGLPVGAIVNLNTSTPGVATITLSSPSPLGAGTTRFADLQADVPSTALYRNKQVLDIANISLNGGAIPALDDDAVHVVAYFGDVTANGTYSAQDASLVARLAVGLDGGLAAFPLLDPAILADITGNGSFSATDTSRMLQAAVGIPVPEIPTPLPTVSLIQGGPDPKLSIPRNLIAAAGQSLSIPVEIDSIVDLTGNGLTSADLVLYYDPRVIDVHRATLGTLLTSLVGWMISSRIDPLAGRIDISIASSTPLEGEFIGELVRLQATVRENAPAGGSAINLAATSRSRSTQLNEGYLTLIPPPTDAANDPIDGLLTITANPTATAGATARLVDNRLLVIGTCGDDMLLIKQAADGSRLIVRANQRMLGTFARPASIAVDGLSGRDYVYVDPSAPATLIATTADDASRLPDDLIFTGDNVKLIDAQLIEAQSLDAQSLEAPPSAEITTTGQTLSPRDAALLLLLDQWTTDEGSGSGGPLRRRR